LLAIASCGLLQWNADIPVRIHPEMRVSPLLTCGLAHGNADIPVRIPHSALEAGRDACVPVFSRPYFVRASAMAGFCIGGRLSNVKTLNRELTRG
ncbi:MAG: hypothetical protein ACRD6X_05645, partial [Pyrinomonadaceae bacterium]